MAVTTIEYVYELMPADGPTLKVGSCGLQVVLSAETDTGALRLVEGRIEIELPSYLSPHVARELADALHEAADKVEGKYGRTKVRKFDV